MCFKQYFKPIFCLKALFKRYLEFANKICPALCICRLMRICAYRRTRPKKLICKNPSIVYFVTNLSQFNSKFNRRFFDCFIRH